MTEYLLTFCVVLMVQLGQAECKWEIHNARPYTGISVEEGMRPYPSRRRCELVGWWLRTIKQTDGNYTIVDTKCMEMTE